MLSALLAVLTMARICIIDFMLASVLQLLTFGLFLILLTVFRVAEGKVFAQHFRAGRIPSLWCVMNILQYCYVIYTKGLGLKAPSLHPLATGSSSWSVLTSWVFILLYKQEHSAPELEVISGWLLMILKTD